MTCWRIFLSVVFPPLAVLDRGCGVAIIVFFLTLAGWLPGVVAALLLNLLDMPARELRLVEIPLSPDAVYEKPKRKGAYLRLQDGGTLHVIEDDDQPLDFDGKRKRRS
jgi:uncharacterized membrane protein YqaE (UPF0057 family)